MMNRTSVEYWQWRGAGNGAGKGPGKGPDISPGIAHSAIRRLANDWLEFDTMVADLREQVRVRDTEMERRAFDLGVAQSGVRDVGDLRRSNAALRTRVAALLEEVDRLKLDAWVCKDEAGIAKLNAIIDDLRQNNVQLRDRLRAVANGDEGPEDLPRATLFKLDVLQTALHGLAKFIETNVPQPEEQVHDGTDAGQTD